MTKLTSTPNGQWAGKRIVRLFLAVFVSLMVAAGFVSCTININTPGNTSTTDVQRTSTESVDSLKAKLQQAVAGIGMSSNGTGVQLSSDGMSATLTYGVTGGSQYLAQINTALGLSPVTTAKINSQGNNIGMETLDDNGFRISYEHKTVQAGSWSGWAATVIYEIVQ